MRGSSRASSAGPDLQLVPTAGSMDNIRGLLRGDLDVALVQIGNQHHRMLLERLREGGSEH